MFIYICHAPPHSQFTKTLNSWNSEKVYLVVCACLWLFVGDFWSFAGGLWWLVGSSWSFTGGLQTLLLVCSGL